MINTYTEYDNFTCTSDSNYREFTDNNGQEFYNNPPIQLQNSYIQLENQTQIQYKEFVRKQSEKQSFLNNSDPRTRSETYPDNNYNTNTGSGPSPSSSSSSMYFSTRGSYNNIGYSNIKDNHNSTHNNARYSNINAYNNAGYSNIKGARNDTGYADFNTESDTHQNGIYEMLKYSAHKVGVLCIYIKDKAVIFYEYVKNRCEDKKEEKKKVSKFMQPKLNLRDPMNDSCRSVEF